MSLGLQCIDAAGNVYFDTNTQQYYHIVGRFVSRVENDYVYGTWIRIPAAYANDSHLYCVQVAEWKSPTRGNKWFMGMYSDGTSINFKRVGTQYLGDPNSTAVSLIVFSKLPVAAGSETFGLECIGDSGSRTFSTYSASHCLQINEYRNYSYPFSGLIGEGNAVLISSLPYQVVASGAQYANVTTTLFRRQGAQVETSYGSIGSQRVSGGYSFPYLSVATVSIPDIPIPVLSW